MTRYRRCADAIGQEHRLRAVAPFVLVVAMLLPASSLWSADADKPATAPAATAEEVAQLIKQLGDADFAIRERAQAELAQRGLDAFDALNEATKSDDIEIALRAKFLVRSMSVRWYAEGDSPDVVRTLKNYGEQPETERKSSMERLAKLPANEGVAALCRLARFEESPELSKRAALLVMEQAEPAEVADKQKLAQRIVETVGTSKRPAAHWLKTYAATLQNPNAAVPDWETIAQKEQETLANQPGETSREIVRDLFRWQVSLLQKLNRDDEAVAAIRRTINLLDGTQEQVTEVVDWLVKREAWSVVEEVAQRFPEAFNETPLLLYRLAETQLRQDKPDLAKETAAKAQSVRAENAEEHLRVAYLLQERGLFDWSEQEYRVSIAATQTGTLTDFRARFFLSELLHDYGKEKEAAAALQPLCELMDKEEAAKAQAVNANRDPEAIYARMHFFRGQQALNEQKQDEAKKEFQKALEYDATDADVLIALFRMPDQDEELQQFVREKIEQAAKVYRDEIEEFSEDADNAPNEQFKVQFNNQVATSCNQFAWLVANTFGDFDEALRSSHRSLELRPDTGGYLDTLGRCYYAKGDLENAVKYQKLAAKFDPHSQAIGRQLKQFERELAEKGGVAEEKSTSNTKDAGSP